jgi:hypothetical protein
MFHIYTVPNLSHMLPKMNQKVKLTKYENDLGCVKSSSCISASGNAVFN